MAENLIACRRTIMRPIKIFDFFFFFLLKKLKNKKILKKIFIFPKKKIK